MIVGTNTVFPHEGNEFHIQAEDLGMKTKSFEVRVYQGGTVLFQKRISYDDIVQQELPPSEFEVAVRTRMDKMVHTVEAAIVKGKIP
ncbi:MAG: hypothetical protein MPN21_26720 [Thermoanaerobaculia bacterium]|nr:hypothetical protein [Thermoanaerobaculia bacterium]